jgi:glycosyltransferase involved in cell wall biosynthesis
MVAGEQIVKILAVSYLYPNLVYPYHGIFVHNRLKAVSHYHDVKIINPIPYFPCSRFVTRYKGYERIPMREKIEGLDVYHPRFFSVPRYCKSIDSYTYTEAVVRTVQDLGTHFPFDLIDLHWTYPDLPAGIKLKEMFNKKLLVTLRGREAFHDEDGGYRKKRVHACLQGVDHAVALSQELKQLAANTGLDDRRISLVRNGVDTEHFYYIPKEKAREQIQLFPTGPMIVCVGSLIFRKGFDRIIAALPEVLEKFPGTCLCIIGTQGPEGDYRRGLEKLIAEKKLNDHVFFVGSISNNRLVYWYNSADLFCLSSRGEGSPNVLSEALACGCPAIATDVGSAKEILDDVRLPVFPNQDSAVTEAILKALSVNYDRKAIAARTSSYDWQWCAEKVNAVYEKVMNE